MGWPGWKGRCLPGAEILLVLSAVALLGAFLGPRSEVPAAFSFQERSGGLDYRFLVRHQGSRGLHYQAFFRSGAEERREEGPLTRGEALQLEYRLLALLRQLRPQDLVYDPSQADYIFQVGASVYRLRRSGSTAEYRLLEALGRSRVGEVRRRLILNLPRASARGPAEDPLDKAEGGSAPATSCGWPGRRFQDVASPPSAGCGSWGFRSDS